MERIKTIAPLKDDLPCIACTPRLCSFVHALKQDVSPHHVGMQRGERLECFTGSCM